eukprot:93714-Prorocentrum_minimum.AAC.2
MPIPEQVWRARRSLCHPAPKPTGCIWPACLCGEHRTEWSTRVDPVVCTFTALAANLHAGAASGRRAAGAVGGLSKLFHQALYPNRGTINCVSVSSRIPGKEGKRYLVVLCGAVRCGAVQGPVPSSAKRCGMVRCRGSAVVQ